MPSSSSLAYGASLEPLFLLVMRDGPLKERAIREMRRLRVPFIAVSSPDEAVAVHSGVAEQIVGVIAEHEPGSGKAGANLVRRLDDGSHQLQALLLGKDRSLMEQECRHLPTETGYLVVPFTDFTFGSRLESVVGRVSEATRRMDPVAMHSASLRTGPIDSMTGSRAAS